MPELKGDKTCGEQAYTATGLGACTGTIAKDGVCDRFHSHIHVP